MAVFVSASDETLGGGIFHHAGWLAPESDWSGIFAPAWQELVLDGPPSIPYLHMTEIRSREWRQIHNLSDADAESRVDAACRVMGGMKSLCALCSQASGDTFVRLFRSHKILTKKGARKQYEPDHLCFLGYVYLVLNWVNVKHPDAEKVDFIVEKKKCVFEQIDEFYEGLAEMFEELGAPELIPLMGKLIPGGKERAPLQAADVLCWHTQRAELGSLTGADAARFESIAHRPGIIQRWTDKELEEMAKNLEK
jgi:hypothetical protein